MSGKCTGLTIPIFSCAKLSNTTALVIERVGSGGDVVVKIHSWYSYSNYSTNAVP